jgi:ADP-glucose pyrophosphorylase
VSSKGGCKADFLSLSGPAGVSQWECRVGGYGAYSHGGTFVLPPYMSDESESQWYQGTADAIYQNLNFIDMIDPEYVVILSGDHIYSMDYAKMLAFHKKHHAATTVGTLRVPWNEASRFRHHEDQREHADSPI